MSHVVNILLKKNCLFWLFLFNYDYEIVNIILSIDEDTEESSFFYSNSRKYIFEFKFSLHSSSAKFMNPDTHKKQDPEKKWFVLYTIYTSQYYVGNNII